MTTPSATPQDDGRTLFAHAIDVARQSLIAINDPTTLARLQATMEDCHTFAVLVVEAAQAEGTALAVLPELVTPGTATAMPLADFDRVVNAGLLTLGEASGAVHQVLTGLKAVARDVIAAERNLSRERIERLGGPQQALRLLTPVLLQSSRPPK